VVVSTSIAIRGIHDTIITTTARTAKPNDKDGWKLLFRLAVAIIRAENCRTSWRIALLTRDNPRDNVPDIKPQPGVMFAVAAPPATPVNSLQLSMIAAVETVRQQRELQPQELDQLRLRVPTVAHLTQYFEEAGMTRP
jgi:hypothetical protein